MPSSLLSWMLTSTIVSLTALYKKTPNVAPDISPGPAMEHLGPRQKTPALAPRMLCPFICNAARSASTTPSLHPARSVSRTPVSLAGTISSRVVMSTAYADRVSRVASQRTSIDLFMGSASRPVGLQERSQGTPLIVNAKRGVQRGRQLRGGDLPNRTDGPCLLRRPDDFGPPPSASC